MKEHHSESSMDDRIRMARKLKEVFAPDRMIFKKFEGKKRNSSSHHVCAKKRGALKIIKHRFWGRSIFRWFLLLPVSWKINPPKR
jgi:hypothetical protein